MSSLFRSPIEATETPKASPVLRLEGVLGVALFILIVGFVRFKALLDMVVSLGAGEA